ncbi:MAG TPA: UvrD-helicase domain-containing protein, partial [Candidatus Sulfomarinibacteraceae bacterium]|nr:UvrD-helicase domain-containing protein [Candidatus Sulfomarinibacteraceae bacterium]
MSAAGGDLGLRDLETRRLAQCEFERPLMVVAGAGTGKTALLVARVVAWCVGPGWARHADAERSPDQVARRVVERVVAITFTEAAAAEMARKIGEALVRLAAAEGERPVGWDPDPGQMPSDDELVTRASALAREVHRLQASTIHGFCQRLLRTHPLEAGVHPHFQVDPEGARLEDMIAAAVEEDLRGLETDPQRPCWERLAADGFGPPQVAAALRELVEGGVPPAVLELDPFDAAAVRAAADRALAGAEALLAAEGGRLQGIRAPVSVATLEAVAALAGTLRALGEAPELDELVQAVRLLGEGGGRRLKEWSALKLGKQEQERLAGVESRLAVAAGDLLGAVEGLNDPAPAALAAARAVLGPLLAEVERRRRAAGVVSFADQLRRADALLDGAPGVRREVQAGIDQLLVDEFQDTDEVQCRIVRRLALDGPVTARPGLFVVGDPKQSIYAWRSADLRAYDGFVELVRRSRGRVEPLVRNFRSHRPILDEVAAAVAPVMREERGVQPVFEPLQATGGRVDGLGFATPPWSAVEYWAAWPVDEDGLPAPVAGKRRPADVLEARALAGDIRRLHDDGGVPWKEIAVLLRAATGQEVLLEAFRERGVPYEVAREREYYRQREVVEAAALVRCLLEPTDTLALLTVLRSDAVGVPDAALPPLWDEGLPSRMARLAGGEAGSLAAALAAVDRAAARVDAALPGMEMLPRWPQALRAAVAAVAELRRSLRADPPDVFVERVRTLWLAEITAASRFLGGFRRARLDRFFADLETRLSAGDGGEAMLARFLRQAVADGTAGTVAAEPDRNADAVHVMTIHGAKGLDFGHVYLAQIHRRGRGGGSTREAEVGHVDGRLEYRLLGWQTLGFGAVRRVAERQGQAERVRLLYVAMTRAKERLVISGAFKEPGRVVDPLLASSFEDLVASRGDPEALEAQAAAGAARRAAGERGVQWVLPALEGGAGESGGVDAEQVTSELVARARCDGRDLAAARTAAEARMARPLVGAASALAHALL